jgi:UDP-N-acetylmuramoyl-L-alanyl-D-glutamate--2,6-diaminopimelate ligase
MMADIDEVTGMSLSVLLEGLVGDEVLLEYGDVVVTDLSHDSRKVREGGLFVAFPGERTHGLMYAVEAVKKGAAVVLWEDSHEKCEEIIRDLSRQALCLQCRDLKMKVGKIADRFYDHPSSKLNMIGVTGTDGKTSIAHFIAQCLDDPLARCGVLGTLGNGFIGELSATGLTTAPVIDVHQSLAKMCAEGASHAVMEVSSHGLDQGRVDAVSFNTAVFSTFSQDHLDYHGTLEAYASAKKKLFTMPGMRAAVINLDDAFGRELAEEFGERLCVWGYTICADITGLKQYSDYIVQACEIEAVENGYRLTVKTPKGSGVVTIGLLGSFNITNVLATLTTLLVSNVPFDDAIKRLHSLHPVMGRMETIRVKGKPTVIVDYAHTPNALGAACKAAGEHFHGSIWCVFGCGGDRDNSKRPLMARAAEQSCNKVVLTSDNPRHEDPQKIIDQVMEGFTAQDMVKVIVDRKQAIEYAISNAAEDDVVLLAGKGHESSQIIGDSYIAFSDSRVARECLGVLS